MKTWHRVKEIIWENDQGISMSENFSDDGISVVACSAYLEVLEVLDRWKDDIKELGACTTELYPSDLYEWSHRVLRDSHYNGTAK